MAKYKFIKDFSWDNGIRCIKAPCNNIISFKVDDIVESANVATTDMGLTSHVIAYKGFNITVPNEYLQLWTGGIATTEPTATTKYYNATVNTAKYGYKVGDAIKVSRNILANEPVGGGAKYYTVNNKKTQELWVNNASVYPVIEEIKIGTEIPASEIEAKGGAAPTTGTNHTVRNVLFVALGLTVVYVLFFQKEPIFKLNN